MAAQKLKEMDKLFEKKDGPRLYVQGSKGKLQAKMKVKNFMKGASNDDLESVKKLIMEKLGSGRSEKTFPILPSKGNTSSTRKGSKDVNKNTGAPKANIQRANRTPVNDGIDDDDVDNLRLRVNKTIPRVTVLNRKKKGFSAKTIPRSELGYLSGPRLAAEKLRGGLIAFSNTFGRKTGPVGEVFHPYFMVQEYVMYIRRFYMKYIEWEREQQVLQQNMARSVASILAATLAGEADADFAASNTYRNKVNSFTEDPSKAYEDSLSKIQSLMSEKVDFKVADISDISKLDPTESLQQIRPVA